MFAYLATGPILAQALSPDARGVLGAGIAPFGLITSVMTLGLPDAVAYFVAKRPGVFRGAIVRTGAMTAVSAVLGGFATFAASGDLSGGKASVASLIVLSFYAMVPNLLLGVVRGGVSGLRLWRLVTIERSVGALVRLPLLVPLWLTGRLDPTSATLVLTLTPVLGVAVYALSWRRIFATVREDAGDQTPLTFRRLLSFGWRTWIGSVSGILLARVDQMLILPLSSAAELGLYVVAVPVAEIPLLISSAFRDVTVVNEAAGAVEGQAALAGRVATFATFVASAAVGLSMGWWVPLLFGGDYGGAIGPAAVLLVATTIGVPGSLSGSALNGRGKPGFRSLSMGIGVGANVVALLLVVPPLGALGAALAAVVGAGVASGLNLFFVQRFVGIPARSFLGIRRGDLGIVTSRARALLPRS